VGAVTSDDRGRRRWSSIFRRPPGGEVDEELAFHLDERARELVAAGMSPEEARSAALERLGNVDGVRRECMSLLVSERRADERRRRLYLSWLDVKLGIRMLIKYPGLTLVGGIAIAFAIWVGASGYEIMNQLVRPTLPLVEGDRVVGIRLVPGVSRSDAERAFYELLLERDGLRSVEDIGAFRTLERNLLMDGDRAEPVALAEITASGFRLTRIAPILGRVIDSSDEAVGAPLVLVIGHDEWQDRFGGSPDVVGRTVRLGREQATIIGVMPEGFAFPVVHGFWSPLRLGELAHPAASSATTSATGLGLFGRLAPGYGLDEARAEVAAIARTISAELPSGGDGLVAELLPYPRMINNVTGSEATILLVAVNLFLVMLVVLACGNVALLMFARAVARQNEIAVRSALGASRTRITVQLFVEALLLAGIAAAAGLMASRFALRQTLQMMTADGGPLPFWFEATLSGETLVYAVLLIVLSAAIAGILPALKVTGRDVGQRMRRVSGGGGRHQLRGIWTAVIVAQVAVTVAFPAIAFFAYRYVGQITKMEVGFPSHEFLAARLELDPAPPFGGPTETTPIERREEMNATVEELKRRLSIETGVRGVTFASHLPRTLHERVLIEADGVAPPEGSIGIRVGRAAVDLDFFDVMDARILAGRGFGPADVVADVVPLIVNRAFVDQVLNGRNPIGMRVRRLTIHHDGRDPVIERSEWHEIVGLVENLGMLLGGMDPTDGAGFYQPATPGDPPAARMAVHVNGSPAGFAPRLRAAASAVDPAIRLEEVVPLDEAGSHLWLEMQFFSRLLMLASAIALLLSLAAIFSVTAFAVARRTREIGIRAALGANPRRILGAIFLRPLLQVGLGVAVGCVLVGLTAAGFLSESISAQHVGITVLYGLIMLAVCALACLVPTRRALSIEPTEAMRADV
jgi:putative ABC transport system permease protein